MEIDACARPRREYTLPPPTVFSVHPSSSRAGVVLQDIREFAVSRESRVLGTRTSVSLATKLGADLSPRIPRVDAIERRESLPALEGAREETKIGQATVDPAAMAAGDSNDVLEPGPDQARRRSEDSVRRDGAVRVRCTVHS